VTVSSLLILGTDAVLTAAPATPVQLAHACLAAGYHAVIPASWGDELIASRCIARLREADGPLLQCSCPHVLRRIAAHGDSLAPLLLPFVSPPVATAQYLRAAYAPTRPRITFAGDCPSGSHQSIDVWLTVRELNDMLAERGIDTAAQPTEFDAVLPPDRRRFFSEPGGVPSRSTLRHLPAPVELVELKGEDIVVELAQQLLSGSRALVDIAPSVGCACSGAVGTVSAEAARARVREQEPPRALGPVVDHSVGLALDGSLPRVLPASTPPVDGAAPPERASTVAEAVVADAAPMAIDATARRRSSPAQNRAVHGVMPHTRVDAGRQLPRAYVARRRSSPRGIRKSTIRGEGFLTDRLGRRALWILGATVGIAMGLGIAWLLRGVL
jgi:hypothetical protein